jgi:hypothetical protein
MAENDNSNVTGVFRSYMTPSGYTQRAQADRTKCDLNVTPAADSAIGHCEYYYRPLGCAYTETVEKVSMSSAWQTVKAFATSWDPWTDKELIHRLLHRREQLIPPQCTDSDWSRHSNFMMRHIGCSHKPPAYYVSYGYYYCSTYGAKLYPKLSPAGQAWLRSARWWLQKNMELGLKQNMQGTAIWLTSQKPGNGSFKMEVGRYQLELEDNTFTTFAFKTHPLAYLDGGLAYLPSWDLAKILMQPNIQEWGDGRTWGQAIDSAKVVIPQQVRDSDMDDPVGKALGRLMAK